jgi:formylglycine-generating enzyme required for sulfatase activity
VGGDHQRLLVVTAHAEQQLAFPVTLGRDGVVSEGATDGGGVAVIGIDAGRPFVQSLQAGEVSVNDEALEGAHWLHPGDIVAVRGQALRWRVPAGDTFSLSALQSTANATLPPDEELVEALTRADSSPAGPSAGPVAAAGTAGAVAEQTIVPVAFERREATVERKRAFPWWAPVGLVGLVFATGLWFVFTAHSVVIDVTPAPDTLGVSGGLWDVEVGGRRLMRSGEYRLEATLEGYHPLQTTFTVDNRAAQRLRFEMRKLPGLLRVSTAPPDGALVSVDGEVVGETPLDPLTLEAGNHLLEVAAPRYRTVAREVEIEGLGREQQLTLALEPDWALVRVETEPPGAEIQVDDQVLGVTPADVELLSGRRELALKLAGHKRVTRTLQIRAGEPQSLTGVRLDPADGLVTLRSSPSGALVTVNGQFRGQTPVELELAPNLTHSIKFNKAGYQSTTRKVELQSGRERSLDVTLAAVTGTVAVTVEPADAELYIGGRRVGVGATRLELAAIEQQIEARRAGYAPASKRVTPQPGFEQQVSITLLTQEAAAYAAIPKRPVVAAGIELVFVDPAKLAGGDGNVLRFQMGSSRRDADRLANEVQYDVELTRAFYVSSREITNAQFRRFRRDHRSGSVGKYTLDAAEQPVVRVTWQQAAAFCNWLSRQEGLPPAYVDKDGELVAASPMTIGYRLPSEAEWAWLARYGGAGEALKFPWGERLPPAENSGNYAGVEARVIVGNTLSTYEDAYVVSAPVGSYPAGRLGLFDMGGNVAEWVHDFFGINVDPGPLVDPLGPKFGRQRVIRGSSYLHGGATELRQTYRDFDDIEREDVGFRVARYFR